MPGLDADVVVVGAGFGGLYMVHRLVQDSWRVVGVEAAADVGGTWYWNRYPGARCDVESLEYSYSFDEALQQEWQWSERYAAQPEILRYAQHVADRFDLLRHFRFNTRVLGAQFDERTDTWLVETSGAAIRCRFVILATGPLSTKHVPEIPGLCSFSGQVLHTGEWPADEPDLAGKRVGVIGTGSSGVQAIPILAQMAAQLVVFQRTATYAVPARNAPIDPALEQDVKANYAEFRERNRHMWPAFGAHLQSTDKASLEVEPAERTSVYEQAWQQGGLGFMLTFTDLLTDLDANDTAAEFVRARIREVVADADVARRLLPSQPIGCKRLCLDSGYYETFNRANVRLVSLDETAITEITPSGVRTTDEHVALDALVFATGFDAMTGSITRLDIRGRGGVSLKQRWATDGPVNYLGIAVPGFPNLFTICGPGSPSVLTNVIVAIEQHVEWIGRCLRQLRECGLGYIEAGEGAADDWVQLVNRAAANFIYPSCNSWYMGANIPGKARVFMPMPGFPRYVKTCERIEAEGYPGFHMAAAGAGRVR
jgi:cyclohexanone monooxygenase